MPFLNDFYCAAAVRCNAVFVDQKDLIITQGVDIGSNICLTIVELRMTLFVLLFNEISTVFVLRIALLFFLAIEQLVTLILAGHCLILEEIFPEEESALLLSEMAEK